MKNQIAKKIAAEIAALETMSIQQLKRAWNNHFSQDPLWIQREHMIRRIAYQMQVDAFGGLPKSVFRRLQQLAEAADTKFAKPTVSPGTELVRDYGDRHICVRVLERGFEYNGVRYTSLSAIASEVMGCRVSGPKFFGLRGGSDAA